MDNFLSIQVNKSGKTSKPTLQIEHLLAQGHGIILYVIRHSEKVTQTTFIKHHYLHIT